MAWLGKKKLAFIPVFRPQLDVVPPDWAQQIEKRIYLDPNTGGADISLRTYIVKISNGRADLEGHVLPIQQTDRIDVPPTAFADRFESRLREQGFDAAALVMLGQPPSGTADSGMFWVRFVMAEGAGVWAMEFIHILSGLGDLRSFGADITRDLGSYDVMSSAFNTHPTSYTKRDVGWLDPDSVTRHAVRSAVYNLHVTALAQPAPAGRTTAVEVGAQPPVLMLEARRMVDQFDAGIRAEGVIVYELTNRESGALLPFRRPLIELRTERGLQPGQGFVSATGVKVNVLSAIVGGFTVSVEDPTFHLADRSSSLHAPNAASAVTVAVIPGTSTYDIGYRAGSSHLFELWSAPGGDVGTSDLTAIAQGGAPNAAGNPFFYTDTTDNRVILLFRDGGGTVRSLYWTTAEVGHDNLSGTAHAPAAAGDPMGYYVSGEDMHHVIYRASDGHLHELFWQGDAPVGHGGDLTALASAPPADGNPSSYFDVRGTNIVAYRATDSHIRSLYWTTGAVGHDDLSGFAHTPAAAGDPWAYYTPHDDVSQIVYRASNGHIYELYWQGIAPVAGWDLTAASGAPTAAGDPTAYYHAVENTKHVIYRGPSGSLHEIWWVPGGGLPSHEDLTAAYGAPPAADKPFGFSVPWDSTQHVAYRGTDGHVYELIW